MASHWARQEPDRQGLNLTDWQQLSTAVEGAFRGALREHGSHSRFTANNYMAAAIPVCRHHKPSPEGVPKVRTTRLRRLGRRFEQWHKHPDPQLSRHVLREAAFFQCFLDPLDPSTLPAMRQWLQEEFASSKLPIGTGVCRTGNA